ncbi:MAG: hypothetical protein LC437_07110, partial [Thiohalomonas sp.]|nr:hypothetical protein [Thiohalomonas sp.]
PQLLAIKCPDKLDGLLTNVPWQRNKAVTAGRIRLGLLKYFSQVRIRDGWNLKSQKFQQPDTDILKQFEVFV